MDMLRRWADLKGLDPEEAELAAKLRDDFARFPTVRARPLRLHPFGEVGLFVRRGGPIHWARSTAHLRRVG
jgi:hypothetical protein